MKRIHDWWCPELLSGPGNYLRRSTDALLALEHLAPERRGFAIQAGGHIGTVPVLLAEHFHNVVTLEPHPDNFKALQRNLLDRVSNSPRVHALEGALGPLPGSAELWTHERISGQHRVRLNKPGKTVTFTIDELCHGHRVDAIFLDVEGNEIPALEGARETIMRDHPVVMAEENKRCQDMGFKLGDLGKFMEQFGYRKVASVGEDLVFAWRRT